MKKQLIGIIGGTGLSEYPGLEIQTQKNVSTPLGEPSAPLIFASLHGQQVVFLARHGSDHSIAPHKVNYRANLLVLKEVGVTHIIAVNAVGGITEKMASAAICIPDQIIDYTYGREQTFFDGEFEALDHIDFSYPYDAQLSTKLNEAAKTAQLSVVLGGTYGATQGPRLESIAEISRLEKDGCDLVGMTGMPEAALARELEIPYVCLALVVNKAAGKSEGVITMEQIYAVLDDGMKDVQKIIASFLKGV